MIEDIFLLKNFLQYKIYIHYCTNDLPLHQCLFLYTFQKIIFHFIRISTSDHLFLLFHTSSFQLSIYNRVLNSKSKHKTNKTRKSDIAMLILVINEHQTMTISDLLTHVLLSRYLLLHACKYAISSLPSKLTDQRSIDEIKIR